MTKRLCRKQYKILFFLVQSICVIFIVGSLCFLSFNTVLTVKSSFGTYEYQFDFWNDTDSYEETEFFDTLVHRQIYDFMRYIVIRNQMEDDGQFNVMKEVDIQWYAMRNEVGSNLDTNYSVRYYLADLIKWGQSEFEYEDGKLIEIYETVDKKYLEDYAIDDAEYDLLVQYLKDSAKDIAYNYRQYNNYKKLYDEASTNAFYYIVIEEYDESSVYTNLEVDSIEEARAIIGGDNSRYVDYDMTSLSYNTNTAVTEDEMIQEMNRYGNTYRHHGNSQILIGINTNYLNNDIFLRGNEFYNKVVPLIPYAVSITLIATILLVVLLVCSVIVSGRMQDKPEVIFLKVDEISTELFLVIFVAFFFILSQYGSTILYDGVLARLNKSIIVPVIIIIIYASYVLFFTMILSLARRFKGKTIIRRSILWNGIKIFYKILIQSKKNVKEIYCYLLRNKQVTLRTFVPYCSFIGLNIILFNMGNIGIILVTGLDCLIALSLLRENQEHNEIIQIISRISNGDLEVQLDCENMTRENQKLGHSVNLLRDGIREALEISRKDERLKSELITNVSHDIKTPLTSIINYVDLLKREEFQNERVQSYLIILDQKSNRLKHLIEDLVEASKISSGNIELIMEELNIVQLVKQSIGEFTDLFEQNELHLIVNIPKESIIIEADGRRIWRIIENLVMNALKYSMKQTRVYIDLMVTEDGESKRATIIIRNITKVPLNMSVEELTERFTRGDTSRTTEGSGLGLSIAKNLTILQGGTFNIETDGDLFKVVIGFLIL